MKIRTFVSLCAVCMIARPALDAQAREESRVMNQSIHPFPIIGHIDYVGASDITGRSSERGE
jgi:hypothetical protein